MPEARKDSSKAVTSPAKWTMFLVGQEFGNSLIARHVAFAAENAPVYRQRRQTERASMIGERVEKGVSGRVIALRGVAKDTRDG